jgi:hypothetical protein
MEPKQEKEEKKKLTREEFEKITSEMRSLVGDKLRNHKDGDAERYLFKELSSSRNNKRRTGSSHANP